MPGDAPDDVVLSLDSCFCIVAEEDRNDGDCGLVLGEEPATIMTWIDGLSGFAVADGILLVVDERTLAIAF